MKYPNKTYNNVIFQSTNISFLNINELIDMIKA